MLSTTIAAFAGWLVREGNIDLVDSTTAALENLADMLDEVSEILEAYASNEGEEDEIRSYV